MTETAIAAVIAAVGSLLAAYLWGRREQSVTDSGKAHKEALKAVSEAIKSNEERAKHEADYLRYLPNDYTDDNDLKFRVPGGPTSPSNKPPGL